MIDYKTNLNCNLNEFHNWNITDVNNVCLSPILKINLHSREGATVVVANRRSLNFIHQRAPL